MPTKAQINCAAWGHGPWAEIHPINELKPQIGRYYFQACDTCGRVRFRCVNRITGAFLDTGWRYDPTTALRKDGQPMTKQDWRRLHFKTAKKPARHLKAV